MEKLDWWGYLRVKNEDMFSGVDRIPVCDRRTERQTSCHGIVRAMHTRRAVKTGLDYDIEFPLCIGLMHRMGASHCCVADRRTLMDLF